VVGGIPFMCGGHHYYQESDSCWKYDLVQDAWSQTGNMSKRGISMASVYSDEFGGLVLTGGWNPEQKERFYFVEVTKDGRSFETLTPMPAGVDKHCLAVIDADRVMVVGGHSSKFGYSSRAAFMYDKMATGKWTSLADMPTGRYSVGCGTVRDGNGVALQVVVAGGANKESLDTVEIYDVVKGTWKTGK
jgi:N-acetylneuraminic acid mutarotase